MFNFSGERVKTLNSFQKSVSVMKCILGNLVVGSHDGVVKVTDQHCYIASLLDQVLYYLSSK